MEDFIMITILVGFVSLFTCFIFSDKKNQSGTEIMFSMYITSMIIAFCFLIKAVIY